MDPTAKQQAVESVKQATNVLVTVSANPSVDQLSAALGLTLMLSKLDKHATAVFSGMVPEAIKFLEPDKTLENNVDSLRDFIIALDKNKADKLRYKVEDDVVKIFITPYKTNITQDDFQFSQGDFNVDVVVALGVEKREDLDNAIKAHGRILHDSTVVTINASAANSKLGAINWSDNTASSLCEMLVSISESFGSGLLDQQISTAFLTGIVAATERFSNSHTTPKVMTMSAQLMASGANQQLIANELQLEQKTPEPPKQQSNVVDVNQASENQEQVVNLKPYNQDNNSVQTDNSAPPSDEKAKTPPHLGPTIPPDTSNKSLKDLENEIAALSGSVHSPADKTDKNIQELSLPQTRAPSNNHPMMPPIEPLSDHSPHISDTKGQGPLEDISQEPSMGGTFNATSSEAHEEIVKERKKDLSSTILSHDDSNAEAPETGEVPAAPTMHLPPIQPQDKTLKPQSSTSPSPQQQPQPQDSSDLTLEVAREAVNNAVNNQPFNPANNPSANIGSQPLPEENPEPQSQSQQINIDDNGTLTIPQAGQNHPSGDE